MKKLVPLTAVRKEALFHINEERELIIRCGKRGERFVYVINLSNVHLFRHIPADLHLHDADVLRIIYVLFKYALRIGDSRELRKFKCLPKHVLPSIRDAVFASKEMLELKLATIACLMQDFVPNKHLGQIRQVFRAYNLSKDDALLYALLFHNGDLVNFVQELKMVDEGFDLTVEALKSEVSTPEVQKKLRSYASFWAYKKLRFVYLGNNLTIEDMVNELMLRAIQAYYWVRPFYTRSHALNYAARSIEKQTLNIIRHYNAPERERVVSQADGTYTNTIMCFGKTTPSDGFTEDAMLLYLDYKNVRYNREIAA